MPTDRRLEYQEFEQVLEDNNALDTQIVMQKENSQASWAKNASLGALEFEENYEILKSSEFPKPSNKRLNNQVRHKFKVDDKLDIEFVRGELANEETNVIVNLNDEVLSCQGSVSQQLIAVGGPTIRQDCEKIMSERQGKGLAKGSIVEAKTIG